MENKLKMTYFIKVYVGWGHYAWCANVFENGGKLFILEFEHDCKTIKLKEESGWFFKSGKAKRFLEYQEKPENIWHVLYDPNEHSMQEAWEFAYEAYNEKLKEASTNFKLVNVKDLPKLLCPVNDFAREPIKERIL